MEEIREDESTREFGVASEKKEKEKKKKTEEGKGVKSCGRKQREKARPDGKGDSRKYIALSKQTRAVRFLISLE